MERSPERRPGPLSAPAARRSDVAAPLISRFEALHEATGQAFGESVNL